MCLSRVVFNNIMKKRAFYNNLTNFLSTRLNKHMLLVIITSFNGKMGVAAELGVVGATLAEAVFSARFIFFFVSLKSFKYK